ncbi:hypothetical protein GGR02_003533 [Anoxybacillus voinovskiensis]|uniref:Uncharacterized protein n=1 Tax=Anoxybacteroides voinovskiense TaxID=230470 RepID=A0A840E1M5_9BACL|nr:hypothetical protein [Anoxybacillus voinovskiensis]
MAKVFDERRAIFVPASRPHPECTEYRTLGDTRTGAEI